MYIQKSSSRLKSRLPASSSDGSRYVFMYISMSLSIYLCIYIYPHIHVYTNRHSLGGGSGAARLGCLSAVSMGLGEDIYV